MRDVNILKNNGVNVEKALELFGDMETYDDTLQTFLQEIDGKLTNIAKYKEIADMANYAILVHSLKSDAKYFGFDKLAEMSYQHELESKANHIYFVYENYDSLMNEANRVVSVVRQYFGEAPIVKTVQEQVKDKKILIVDDSDVISGFIKRIFNATYEVVVAKDGQVAINYLASNTDFCAMLLDLNMPNVNGFAVLQYMSNNHLFEKTPVSIITGVGDDAIIDQARVFPIKDVLRKPFNERDVKQVVEKTIGR